MTDAVFLKFLKSLSEQKEPLETEAMNEQVEELFDIKLFTTVRTKNYFQKLVSYYMSIIQRSNLEKSFKLLDTIYKKLYTNNRTLDNKFTSHIRSPIFTRFGRNGPEHKASKKFAKLSYEDKKQVIADANKKLNENHEEVIRFDTEEVFKIIKRGINSEDVYEKAVALALASGCRPVELFNDRIHFQKVDESWVIQSEVAKKRSVIVSVEKPIIGISSDQFIEQIGDMRYFIKSENRKVIERNGELNGNIENKANQKTKQLFGYEDKITLYFCRKVYGSLSYDLFSKSGKCGKDPTLQLWISRVLAHSGTDIKTALHYSNLKPIKKDISETDLELLKAKITHLEEVIDSKKIIETKPIVSKKDSKQKKYFEAINEIYKEYKSNNKIPLTQTDLERLCAGISPRSYVRLFYKQNLTN